MKYVFEPKRRYRVRFALPKLLDPKTLLAILGKQLSSVVISDAKQGQVVIEATWLGPRRQLDTEFLLQVEPIAQA